MADLGTIATNGTGATGMPDQAPRLSLRGFSLCGIEPNLFSFGGRDNAQGDPAQPSLRMDARGVYRFRWAFESGARTVAVNVKQEVNLSPRPTLVVKANPAIGIASDVIETAGSSTNWITIGPANISPSADGATWVELHANYDGQYMGAPCYWDHIETT